MKKLYIVKDEKLPNWAYDLISSLSGEINLLRDENKKLKTKIHEQEVRNAYQKVQQVYTKY